MISGIPTYPFVTVIIFFVITSEAALLNTKIANHIPVHIMKRQLSVPISAPTHQQATLKSSNPTTSLVENVSHNISMRNVPNVLSLIRLAAIPPFIISFLVHSKTFVTGIFVAASLTDFLDGYIARRYQLTSEFGAFLDPVADKVLRS